MDVSRFGEILSAFLSPDETKRRLAEQEINTAKEQQPDHLVALTLQVLLREGDVTRRQQAAVLLRNIFRALMLGSSDVVGNVWMNISNETRALFKSQILQCLEAESVMLVKRAIGDVIADVGGALLDKNEWPELPGYIVNLCQSPDCNNSAVAIRTLADLVPRLGGQVSQDIDNLANLIAAKLQTGDIQVKVQCVSVIAQLIAHEQRKVWKRFQAVVPSILELINAVATTDEDSLEEILRKICEIGECDAELFKRHIQAVLETLLLVAKNKDIDSDARQLAVEAVLSILESKPQMCIKVPNFLEVFVGTLMEFMLCIDEEWDSLDYTNIDEANEESRNYDCGESGMDRVAAQVGGAKIMPVIFKHVANYLQHADWQHKFSAIMAISQTVEYLDEDEIERQLAEIVDMLMRHLQDPHPRVRFAACQAIGQTALDHQPYFQETYADRVLPALVTAFEDPSARVQAHAISAFINFGEEVSVKELLPHADLLMQKFLARLSEDFQMPVGGDGDAAASPEKLARRSAAIREQSLTAIAVVAGVIEKEFSKYYSTVVPLTKLIVEKCTTKEQQSLRGKALECLSIIGFSVGLEMFRPDADSSMRAMLTLLRSEAATMEEDDPVKVYLYEAVKRMIRVLGKEFAQYLPEILPFIQKYLTLKPEIRDADEAEIEDYTLTAIQKDGKFRGMKTSAIEDIEKALELLEAAVEATQELYAPAMAETFSLVIPMLEFDLSETVRHQALLAIAELFGAANAAKVEKQLLVTWVTQVVDLLFKQVSKDELICGDIDDMTADTGGLARCLENAGPDVLTEAHVVAICEKIFTLMQNSAERRTELAAAAQDPDNDEEDATRLAEEQDREQLFRSTLLETIGAVMKNHPRLFMEKGASLCVQFMRSYLMPEKTPEDRALALYVADDILEQLNEQGQPLWPEFAEKLCQYVLDKDASVRQAAAYGSIWIAKMREGLWDITYLRTLISQLDAALKDPIAFKKDNRQATDNVIAALLAFVLHAPHAFEHAQSLQLHAFSVIEALPLKADAEEGQRVHEEFVAALADAQKSVLFLGSDNVNMPKVVKILGAIYRTSFTNEKTDVAIRNLLSHLGQSSVLEVSSKTALTPTERKGLEKAFSDAASTTTVSQ